MESEYYNSDRLVYSHISTGEDSIIMSQYGTSEELNELNDGYPILRLNEYDGAFIRTPSKYCNMIDEETYSSLKLKKDDVLICRTNGNPKYVGKAALVPEDNDYGFASYLFRVRPNEGIINSATLVAYLNSSYGRKEIERLSVQSNQVNFSPAKFREISIPVFPVDIQKKIKQLTYQAYDLLRESKTLFENAQKLINSYLTADRRDSRKPSTSLIRFSDSFGKFKRIDAEYYDDEYKEIISAIQDGDEDYWYLSDSMIIDDNFIPEVKKEYKYIELSNVNSFGSVQSYTTGYGGLLPSRARRLVITNDVLVSSLEGSLNSCALVTLENNLSLCSNGFYVLRNTPLQPELLLMLTKSILIQRLLKRGCSGHIMSSINKEELKKIPLPYIKKDIADRITKDVKRSIELRIQSQKLVAETHDIIVKEISNEINRINLGLTPLG